MLRPGVALGRYPQREDIREGWLDRAAASAMGSIRAHLHGWWRPHTQFVSAVNAWSDTLSNLHEQELTFRIADLRRRLYGEGIDDELAALSFAVIRVISERKLSMRHFDVQLIGGRVMLQGKIAEMETGEGKTLTATLPAATAALAGIPVHIVTVNDFLVERDAKWMRPIYEALGLSVGTITEQMSPEARRAAYACDITYCTNKQLVFDYLKDRLVLGPENRRLHLQVEGLYRQQTRTDKLLLRGLCFAIVDEADSVLIDEARTPLIISSRGDAVQEETTYLQAIRIASELSMPRDFTSRPRERRIELTDFGKARIAKHGKNLGGIWAGARRREELVCQALSALHLYQANKHYLLQDEKVRIIDEYTGRVMQDRSWERGLHQMIEAKEGFSLTGRQETLARISYQRFFRRYLRLAGMTGTAREVSQELWSVYRLDVVSVPTNKPLRREALSDTVCATADRKWKEVIRRVRELHRQGRPVLIGTRSVAASELLSKLLRADRLPHEVLNARQDRHEAQIVGQAGQKGRITVATNMAGRGTDIRLSPGVADLGGLHVLATERHDAHRIDRQLFGRAGRQGDPGSYEVILALDDELIVTFWGNRLQSIGEWFEARKGVLPRWLAIPLVALAQRSAERHNSQVRKDLQKLDDNLSDLLAFTGRPE